MSRMASASATGSSSVRPPVKKNIKFEIEIVQIYCKLDVARVGRSGEALESPSRGDPHPLFVYDSCVIISTTLNR